MVGNAGCCGLFACVVWYLWLVCGLTRVLLRVCYCYFGEFGCVVFDLVGLVALGGGFLGFLGLLVALWI